MKILLVNPATKKDRLEKPGEYKGSSMFRYPKLGTLAVAGVTPARHEIEILDETVDILDFTKRYDVVGISAVTALAKRAYEIAAEFKKTGALTVIGGCHATLMPGEASGYVDSVVVGQAESLWPKLLSDLEAGRERVLKIYSDNGAGDPAMLAGKPFPARFKEGHPGYAAGHVLSAIRGCSKKCDFCSIHSFFGGRVYKRPVDEVCGELSGLGSFIINLVDDNIFSDPAYAKELFRAVKKFNKHWLFQASVDAVRDRRLMRILAEAGAKGVFVGFETVSAKNLLDVNKKHNRVDEFRRVIDVFHDFGIVVEAGMMFGFDDDDPSVFEATYDFFYRANLDLMQIATVTPMPGTAFYERMHKQGRIISSDWDDFDCKKVVIEPLKMTSGQLRDGTDWLRKNFYSLSSILKRGACNFFKLGVVGTLGYFLRGNLGFRKNHSLGLDYPP